MERKTCLGPTVRETLGRGDVPVQPVLERQAPQIVRSPSFHLKGHWESGSHRLSSQQGLSTFQPAASPSHPPFITQLGQ